MRRYTLVLLFINYVATGAQDPSGWLRKNHQVEISNQEDLEGDRESIDVGVSAECDFPLKCPNWQTMGTRYPMKHISVSANGKHVWGIGTDDKVYYSKGVDGNGNWKLKDGSLVQISVDNNSNHVWGVNSKQHVYYRDGVNGKWEHVKDQNLKYISVSADGNHLWGVDKNDKVWYRKGWNGKWQKKDGSLVQVSVDFNGQNVWGVNKNNDVYHRFGANGSWTEKGGGFKSVAIEANGFRALGITRASNNNGNLSEYFSGKWQSVNKGELKQVSPNKDSSELWGIPFSGKGFPVYCKTQCAEPEPTNSPTIPPDPKDDDPFDDDDTPFDDNTIDMSDVDQVYPSDFL